MESSPVKTFAESVGFDCVGVIGHERLPLLSTGLVGERFILRSPESILPSVRSVIIMGYKIWDQIFNLAVSKSDFDGNTQFHMLSSEVISNKSWLVARHLMSLGYDAVSTRDICLKKAAVLGGLGAQGKQTVVVSPLYGPHLRFVAVLTSAELEEDSSFTSDLCRECRKCIESCPVMALGDYSIDIYRCLVYAAENTHSELVALDVREKQRHLVKRPTNNSFIECTICLDVCPIGRSREI